MKSNRTVAWVLLLLIVVAALYRVIPNRPYGFAPQIAMAVFAGLVIKDRKWAFAIPIFSMFISDGIYEILYQKGLSDIRGFYEWQLVNYLLFFGMTGIGMAFKKVSVKNFVAASLIAPTAFFLASNFVTWITGFGLQRPRTLAGLMQCYVDGIPFFGPSVVATLVFGAVFFVGYYFLNNRSFAPQVRV